MRSAARALGLAWAEASRTGSKSLLVALVAAAAAASLALALALGRAVDGNTRAFLVGRYSGEIVVAQGETGALFGYASVTGNESQATIANAEAAWAIAAAQGGVASISPLVDGYLSLEKEGRREQRALAFGIDPARPRPSGLGFPLGPGSRMPGPGEVLLSSSFARRVDPSGAGLKAGELLTACALKDAGMALRPLRVSGTYEYSGGMGELDNIVYLEAGTARRLLLEAEGGQTDVAPDAGSAPGRAGDSEDELFSEGTLVEDREPPPAASERNAAKAPARGPDLRWHYLRLALKPGADAAATRSSLNASFAAAGLGAKALDWGEVSSGYAASGGILRSVLLACIGTAAAFALLVLSNSLELLARSRRKSYGTARAIGATRSFIAAWTIETVLLAAGIGAIAGSALASAALAAVSAIAPELSSPAIRELFASDRLVVRPAWGESLLAAAIAITAACLAAARSARRSAAIAPADAMRE